MEYHQLQLVEKGNLKRLFSFVMLLNMHLFKKNIDKTRSFYRHQSDITSCRFVNKSFQIKLCPISLLLYTVRC